LHHFCVDFSCSLLHLFFAFFLAVPTVYCHQEQWIFIVKLQNCYKYKIMLSFQLLIPVKNNIF
jgi:hypothetical protein